MVNSKIIVLPGKYSFSLCDRRVPHQLEDVPIPLFFNALLVRSEKPWRLWFFVVAYISFGSAEDPTFGLSWRLRSNWCVSANWYICSSCGMCCYMRQRVALSLNELGRSSPHHLKQLGWIMGWFRVGSMLSRFAMSMTSGVSSMLFVGSLSWLAYPLKDRALWWSGFCILFPKGSSLVSQFWDWLHICSGEGIRGL